MFNLVVSFSKYILHVISFNQKKYFQRAYLAGLKNVPQKMYQS